MIDKRPEEEMIAENIKELEKLKEEANKLKKTGASYKEQKALEKKLMTFAKKSKLDPSPTENLNPGVHRQQMLIAEIMDILISVLSPRKLASIPP